MYLVVLRVRLWEDNSAVALVGDKQVDDMILFVEERNPVLVESMRLLDPFSIHLLVFSSHSVFRRHSTIVPSLH